MTLQLEIPDELATMLSSPACDTARTVLEGFAVEAFRDGRLTTFQVRQLLEHDSRWETQAFLSAHGAWPTLTAEEILADADTAAAFALPR